MKTVRLITLHALVVAVGLFSCFRPTFASRFERMQSDDGDTVLNNYLLEHTWLWLSDRGYPFGFWSPGFFHPTPGVLTYSENMIGTAPLYWGLRTAFDETVAFSLWQMLLFILDYASLAWVFQRWKVPLIWSVGLCFVFAFGLVRSSQICHQQLHGQFFSVLAIFEFKQFFERQSIARWFRMGIFVAGQCLAGIYLGWFLCFGLATAMALMAVLDRAKLLSAAVFIRSNPLSIAAVTFAWTMPTVWFFSHYLLGNDSSRTYAETCTFMPDFRNGFIGCSHSLWDCDLGIGQRLRIDEGRQSNGLILYFLYLLAGWNAIRMPAGSERTWIRCLLLTGLFLMLSVVDLGGGTSIWWAVYHVVPGADALRAIGRIALMAHLFGLLAVGLAAKHHARLGCNMPWQYALLSLMLLEQTVWHHASFSKAETYGKARVVALECADWDLLYIDDPDGGDSPQHEALAMWIGLYARKPVVNGYSGRTPSGYWMTYPPTDLELIEFAKPGPQVRFGRVRWNGSRVEIRGINSTSNGP